MNLKFSEGVNENEGVKDMAGCRLQPCNSQATLHSSKRAKTLFSEKYAPQDSKDSCQLTRMHVSDQRDVA